MPFSGPSRARAAPALLATALIAIGAALLAGITEYERRATLEVWHARLSDWADERRASVDRWVAERSSNAQLVAGYPTIRYLLDALPRGTGVPFPIEGGPRHHARELLWNVTRTQEYDAAWVLDKDARLLASTHDTPAALLVEACAREVVSGGRPAQAFGSSQDGRPLIAFGAPVRGGAEGQLGAVLGAVVLQDDPTRFLYPYLRGTVGGMRSGETVLLGPLGTRDVFLSPLRDGTRPFDRGVPVERAGLAGAAALEGREQVGAFVDYAGARVVAATRRLKNAPWALVVKVDESEALGSARRASALLALVLTALLAALFSAGWAHRRSERAAFEAALARRAVELADVLDQANDAILFIAQDGRILHANQQAAAMYRYAREELLQLRIDALCLPGRPSAPEQTAASLAEGQPLRFETEHLRHDGQSLPVEGSSRNVTYQGEPIAVTVLRDVSVRRAAEASRARVRGLLRALAAVNHLARDEADGQRLLEGACRALVEECALLMAWVAFNAADGSLLSASHGALALGPSSRGEDNGRASAAEHGPVATVMAEGRALAIADTAADARFPAWAAAAAAHGCRSAALSPIRGGASVDGVLVVYAAEPGCFEGEVVALLEQLGADLGVALNAIEERRLAELAERALQRSQAMLAEAQRLGRVGSFEVDLDTGLACWSEEQYRIYGAAADSPPPTLAAMLSHLHPEDRAAFEAWRAALPPGGAEATREFRIVRAGGALRHVEVVARVAAGEAGPGRFTGTMRDVTERHDALSALSHSERRFRLLAENAPDVLFRFRLWPIRGFDYVSPAVKAALGYAPDEFYADPKLWLSVVHPDDRVLLERLIEDSGSADAVLTLRLTRRDGTLVHMEQRHVLERDAQGRALALEGVARDVTARWRAEEQLRKLWRVVEQSPVSVVVTDARGAIEYVNPKFCELSGYTLEELQGRNPRILKSEKTPAGSYEEMWTSLAAGREWRGEFCNRKRTGELYWERAIVSPIVDASGRTTHYVAVKEDISERRLAQETLRQAQEQLLQSQKMEAVGRLAGGVAHDFNNVLGVITGYSEIVRRSLDAGDARRAKLDHVLEAAQRAAGLTRQLLAFSRRQVLQPRALDLNALVAELDRLLRRLIGEDVELRTELGASLDTVMADPGQLEQVLMNLAVNARDAMPAGGRLTIRTENVAASALDEAATAPLPAARCVRLTVKDTGQGMDEATCARIFEPFFTTKGPDKGTGLGLATVYGIVAQSGGQIRVESAPGQGATFEVYLPSLDKPAAKRGRAPLLPLERGTETLLLAEDEAVLRDLMVETLQSCGYEVLSASCAEEALELAGQHAGPVHMLISDVIMPRTSGRQLAERMSSLRPEARVLYVSGYTADVIGPHGVLEPGIAFLHKPFSGGELARKVREVLDGRVGPLAAGLN